MKPKKPVRTKEQIIHDMEIKKETDRQRELVKNRFVPILVKQSRNIEHAKMMLQMVQNAMKNAFDKLIRQEQEKLSRSPLSNISADVMFQISIMKSGDKDGVVDDKIINDLIFIFKDEPLATIDALLRGMVGEIEQTVKDECAVRKFKTLKLKIPE
jgi:hypothetical protein